MDRIETFINELMADSTPDFPAWNIEKKSANIKSKWNYIDGCMIKAVLEMYAITGDRHYLEFADGFIDAKVFDDGTIDGYDVNERNLDNINAGKTLFELLDLTGKEKYRKAIELIYSQIGMMPRTVEGSFWHKNIYPDQVWLDGLYMCMPFYLEYEKRCNGCRNYKDILDQFNTVITHMKDPLTGLYYHAYDCSRTAFWCDPVTGLSSCFWLRALGWYAMALLDTAEKAMDSSQVLVYTLTSAFKELITAMLKYQDRSGMWYQVVNRGGIEPNYLETSGSSIFAYAILKGVRLGILPESFREYGVRAFKGVESEKLTQDASGKLHLSGICLMAGLGGKNNRTGTFDYYMSEKVVNDDAKGVGPFLLAYTEMRRAGLISS